MDAKRSLILPVVFYADGKMESKPGSNHKVLSFRLTDHKIRQ